MAISDIGNWQQQEIYRIEARERAAKEREQPIVECRRARAIELLPLFWGSRLEHLSMGDREEATFRLMRFLETGAFEAGEG